MELLERYIEALHAELPAAQADEICREVKANILDELEAIPDSEQASQLTRILLHYGDPKQLALRYAPVTPLIAASDMALFWELNRVMLAVIAAIQGLVLLFNWLTSDHIRLVQSVIQYAFATATMAAVGFACITLIFYSTYLSKEGVSKEGHSNESQSKARQTKKSTVPEWSPTDLPAIRFSWQRIKRTDLIQDMASILALVMVLWPSLWLTAPEVSLANWFIPELQLWRIMVLIWCALAFERLFWWLFKPIWNQTQLIITILLQLSLLVLLAWGASYSQWLAPDVIANFIENPQVLTWSYWTRQSIVAVIAVIILFELGRDLLRLRQLRACN